VLVLRRSEFSKHFAGTWELPGGKLDRGESFDQALLREVVEETGLKIALERVAGATQYDMSEARLAVLFMEARPVGGAVRLSDEHDDFRWLPLAKVVKLNLSEQLKAFFKRYESTKRPYGS
jgi:8-oxo-dGTP diphosphatase